jgi:ParB-like nuclease domain
VDSLRLLAEHQRDHRQAEHDAGQHQRPHRPSAEGGARHEQSDRGHPAPPAPVGAGARAKSRKNPKLFLSAGSINGGQSAPFSSRPTRSRNGPQKSSSPYARNARVHSAEQIGQLRGSFRQFGQVWPILIRQDGTIIAGHGRLEAAKAEGFKTIRVIVAFGWTAMVYKLTDAAQKSWPPRDRSARYDIELTAISQRVARRFHNPAAACPRNPSHLRLWVP